MATAHNDSDTRSISSHSTAVTAHSVSMATYTVSECIVIKEKPAVVVGREYDPNIIGPELAEEVNQKAHFFSVNLVDQHSDAATRYGQGGLVRCNLPTEAGNPLAAKAQTIQEKYGEAPPAPAGAPSTLVVFDEDVGATAASKPGAGAASPPAPAIKVETLGRVSAVPITALHNVLRDTLEDRDFTVCSAPWMGAVSGAVKGYTTFHGFNGVCGPNDAVQINFPDKETVSWKYGVDIATADAVRKVYEARTDPNRSFQAVDSRFELKVEMKIGIAVLRNYDFDLDDDATYIKYGWNEDKLSREDIGRIFGPKGSVNIYTGQITGVSDDRKAFCHDINTFKGCSGAIVFLLDRDQDAAVPRRLYGHAIGVHAGAVDEISTTSVARKDVSTTKENYNIAFSLAGFAERYSSEGLAPW